MLLAGASTSASADSRELGLTLEASRRCFQDLDFTCAIKGAVPVRDAHVVGSKAPQRIEALRLIALSHLALGNRSLAQEAFGLLLAEAPAWQPGPGASPRVTEALEAARAKRPQPRGAESPKASVGGASSPGGKASLAPADSAGAAPHGVATTGERAGAALATPGKLVFALGLGYTASFGGDAEVLEGAFGPHGLLLLSVAPSTWLGLGGGYRSHPVHLDDLREGEADEVPVLELNLHARRLLALGGVSVCMGVELGLGMFGKGTLNQRKGLVLRGVGGLLFEAKGGVWGGVMLRPGWLLNEEGEPGFSLPMSIDLGVVL